MALSRFEQRGNNKKIKCAFKKQEENESNLTIITKEKYDEIYLEKQESYPFVDSEKRTCKSQKGINKFKNRTLFSF